MSLTDSSPPETRADAGATGRPVDRLPDASTAGLPLAQPSPEGWAASAARDIDALLIDHAHCEMKAAATGFRLLGSYPERADLVDAMLALVREEMRHFERVKAMIDARGLRFGKARPDRYVKALLAAFNGSSMTGEALIDRLIVCAFVEARSCERFRLLAKEPTVPQELRDFYAELACAEARHHETFIELARDATTESAEAFAARIHAIAEAEAGIIAALPAESAIH